jgi:hypothetical protein
LEIAVPSRTESISNIAAASSPAVGLGILELIPIIEAAISVLSACSGPETPEQFVAAHTNADGTFSHIGVARLRRQVRVEASKRGQDLTRQQADAIAVNMFREGGRHGASLGAVIASASTPQQVAEDIAERFTDGGQFNQG